MTRPIYFTQGGRSCLLWTLALIGVAACSDSEQNADFPELHDLTSANAVIRTAARAVVRVGTATASGTGSFLSASGQMMTNNHVLGADVCPIEGCWIELAFDHQRGAPLESPREVFAVPSHVDVGLDMAVVQVYDQPPAVGGIPLSTPDFLTFERFDAPSLVGQHVTIVGHPQAKLKKWSSGVVIDATGAWFECTNYILPGDSGSPVLNDAGKIVGLIHRGTSSADLLTKNSVNLTALGSASASLVQALEAPLPAVMVSIAASHSADFVVVHNEVYLNGRVHTALVGGVETDILPLLADACDDGLSQQGYTSPEELGAQEQACYDAQGWIDCRTSDGAPDPNKVCPADAAANAAWAARYQAINRRSYELNGQLDLGSITYALAALSSTDSAGNAAAVASLNAALAQAHPLHDFDLAPVLAAFELDVSDTVQLILGYRKVPHYEIYASDIASAVLWLNFNRRVSGKDTRRILHALEDDPKVDTGTKLYIEDVRYNSGDL